MKKVAVAFSLVCLVLCFAPCAALAGGSYLGLKVYQFTPNSDDFDGFDSAVGFELDLGSRFSPNSAFEIGVLYQAPEGDFDYGVGDLAIRSKATMKTIGITFTFKGILPVANNNLDLFLGLGFGMYFTTLDMDVEASYRNREASASESVNGFGFGFHAVGGADFNVAPNLAVGAEMKWDYQNTVFDDPYFEGTYDLGGITFGITAKYKF
jgi:hypothetical protein